MNQIHAGKAAQTAAALKKRKADAAAHPELLLYLMTVTRFDRTGSIKGKEPLGHLTLASYLEMIGWDVKVFAGSIYDALALLLERQEADAGRKVIVGLYCDYENMNAVSNLAAQISARLAYPVIMGGPQAIALDEDYLRSNPGVDAFIRGDGEHAVCDVLSAYAAERQPSLSGIPGVCSIRDGVYTDNGFSDPLMDMDEGPSVRDAALLFHGQRTALAALSGRGCPFHCSFCYEGGNSKTVRLRSVPHMMKELEDRLSDHPEARYIYFGDDTFTLQPERLRAFCDALRELRKKHDFVWFADGHVRVILKHPEYLPMMIDAGMVRMQIGIESTVQSIIDLYQKNITKEELYRVLDICLEAGLPQLAGNIIIGGAMETKESIEETFATVYDLVRRSRGMLDVSSTLYSHFPGTAMSRDADRFGLIIEDPEGCTSFADYPIARTEGLTRDEIAACRRRFIVEIGRVMRDCIAKGDVDESRMLQQLVLKERYGISSLWINFGLTTVTKKYYLFRSRFGTGWDQLADRRSMIPVRTLFFFNAVGFTRPFPEIEGLPLSPLEAELLTLCAGKLTFGQITDRMYASWKDAYDDKEEFSDSLTNRLRYLEKQRLLVYTEPDRIKKTGERLNMTDFSQTRDKVILFNARTISTFSEEDSAGTAQGIYILGAVLKQAGYRVRGCECAADQVLDYVQRENDGSILAVGFSVDYENRRLVLAVSKTITQDLGIPVILGGVDARTITAEEILESGVCAVIKGEGEITLPKVLGCLAKSGMSDLSPDSLRSLEAVTGLLLVRDGRLVDTGAEEPPEDLDSLPFPDYSISMRPLRRKYFYILTSRGCPNRCAFCHEGTHKTRLRMRSIANVLSEIRSLLDAWPDLAYLCFCDDTLVTSPERVKELCDGIREINRERAAGRNAAGIGAPDRVEWFCEADVRSLAKHPDLLPMMVDAGLIRLQIGIESGDDDMLKCYEKNLTADMTRRVVKAAYDAKLPSMAGPILTGAPFENPAHVELEKRWVEELIRLAPGMIEIPISIISPYPQTRIGREPERYGYTFTDATGDCSNTDYPGYRTGAMTEKEILAGYQELTKQVALSYRAVIGEGLVPDWRLRECVRIYQKTGGGFYGRTLQTHFPFIYSYFQLSLSCRIPPLAEVAPEERPAWHIQRTFEIWRFVNFRGGIRKIGSYVLSPFEYQLLLFCAGKLTLADIAERMYGRFSCRESRGEFLARVIDTVLAFEKKYWIVGVPF